MNISKNKQDIFSSSFLRDCNRSNLKIKINILNDYFSIWLKFEQMSNIGLFRYNNCELSKDIKGYDCFIPNSSYREFINKKELVVLEVIYEQINKGNIEMFNNFTEFIKLFNLIRKNIYNFSINKNNKIINNLINQKKTTDYRQYLPYLRANSDLLNMFNSINIKVRYNPTIRDNQCKLEYDKIISIINRQL